MDNRGSEQEQGQEQEQGLHRAFDSSDLRIAFDSNVYMDKFFIK